MEYRILSCFFGINTTEAAQGLANGTSRKAGKVQHKQQ